MIFKSECKVTKKKRTVQIFRMIFIQEAIFVVFTALREAQKHPFRGFLHPERIPRPSRTNHEHFLLATKYSKATQWRTRKIISA